MSFRTCFGISMLYSVDAELKAAKANKFSMTILIWQPFLSPRTKPGALKSGSKKLVQQRRYAKMRPSLNFLVFAKFLCKSLSRHRLAEKIALHFMATQICKHVKLIFSLNAFSKNLHVKRVCKLNY